MLRPELIQLIADRLKLISISRRQVTAAAQQLRTVSWRRLPLYTSATIESVSLQHHLAVTTTLDLHGFVEVYEEFVAGYLLTHELHRWSPLSWLRSKLVLTEVDAAQLFSDGRSRGRKSANGKVTLQNVIALAAVADHTFGAIVRDSTPTTFVVTVDRFRFGVENGRPVTNLGTGKVRTPRVAKLYCKRGLEHYGRDLPTYRESADDTIFTQLYAFCEANPDLLGEDLEGVVLGLGIARWRGRARDPRALRETIAETGDAAGYRQALRLAGGFEGAEDPYGLMRDMLVPAFLTAADFASHFGFRPPGRLTPRRALQWRLALDNLAESIKEEKG